MPQVQTATAGGESFAALFEESLKRSEMRAGEVITAEVVRIDFNYVVVNAGLKSEAYVPIDEFKNDQGEVEVARRRLRVGSHRRHRKRLRRHHPVARQGQAPRVVAGARDRARIGDFVSGTVSGKVKGGLTVLVNGIRAFLPGSLIDTRPVKDLTPFEGRRSSSKSSSLTANATTWC